LSCVKINLVCSGITLFCCQPWNGGYFQSPLPENEPFVFYHQGSKTQRKFKPWCLRVLVVKIRSRKKVTSSAQIHLARALLFSFCHDVRTFTLLPSFSRGEQNVV
jgi:hypothetical protein